MSLLVIWISTSLLWLIAAGMDGQKSLSSLPCPAAATERNGRVVGGTSSERNQMPFIVSLRRRGGHFCGASILNERWLLTAGHCVCNGLNNIMRPNQIDAVFGLHKISEFSGKNDVDGETETAAFKIGLKSIIAHAKYDCQKTDNDIALLELNEPIKFNDAVKPTCIAAGSQTNNNTYDGDSAVVSGWGWTNENQDIGVRADTLQTATVRVWNNQKCQRSYREQEKPHIIGHTQMCAGNNGVDSCWADSGGPLMSSGNVLIGIVSTGIGCARPGLPGIYTRVSEYSGWIESVTMDDR